MQAFLRIPYNPPGGWPTPSWALRMLGFYGLVALSGAVLALVCGALIGFVWGERAGPTQPHSVLFISLIPSDSA
jgi:hypothetical protein